jgi:hypothetical protein
MGNPGIENQGAGDLYQTDPGARAGVLHWVGAVVSLALVGGLGYWGATLIMRDVSGVPVVRKLDGPMRVQPENPGGTVASYQGLAVNEVQAEGTAAAPADRLVLAPELATISEDDQPGVAVSNTQRAATPSVEADDTQIVAPESQVAASLSQDSAPADPAAVAAALIDQITGSATPLEATPDQDIQVAAVKPPEATVAPKEGLARSLRPFPRPKRTAPAAVESAVLAALQEDQPEVSDTERSVAAGTRLVQLGAFDSAEEARTVWVKLDAGRFKPLMEGKSRLIQEAESGGRTFYRLRAVGFADLSDARRFCAALIAGKADCIPVVAR